MAPKQYEIFLTLIKRDDGQWRRVGKYYYSKEAAKSWLPFIRAANHCAAKVDRIRVTLENGVPDERSKKMLEKFKIDC